MPLSGHGRAGCCPVFTGCRYSLIQDRIVCKTNYDMKILANKDIKNLFLAVSVIWAASLLLAQGFLWLRYQRLSLCLLFIFLLAAAAIWVVC